jgi:hypothetical protein
MSISVQILEPDDVLKKDDHVRQLFQTFEGQSDYLATISTYGGGRINRLGWMKAEEVCPFWVGKPIKEFLNALYGMQSGLYTKNRVPYEFIRGPVPQLHWE